MPISIIPLASYATKNVYQTSPKADDPSNQVVTALVGDASQAFPFFRAINNGFILGTKLSQCILKAFESLNEPAVTPQLQATRLASSFDSYSYYSTFRAYVERIRAFVKNLFITLSSARKKRLLFKFLARKFCYSFGKIGEKKIAIFEEKRFLSIFRR
ncbi:MAG: hypothetical protein ACXWM7_02055 [Parachlamydiaceae bacterium]